LLYISNTESDLFMAIGSQRVYVLLAGRWYAAAKLDGPWSPVAPDKLPESFRKIPSGSDKGNVLAHVPGTDAAKEAVLETQIPQTAAVERNQAKVEVTYDGRPQGLDRRRVAFVGALGRRRRR